MRLNKILSLLLAMTMLFSCIGITAMAEGSNVAKVGNTEYATIDEAIANWTKGATLTLLADVTLSDVITLKSTEHHILNLGTYTMTAASGKNAIEIIAYGNGSAEQYAITINADSTNPGGINAGSKSVIYYDYSKGITTGDDRPIIKINGGMFKGATSSLLSGGIYFKGSAARKAATVNISGGTFDCSIYGTGKSKLIISGGTFNYSVGSQGDSTANRLISGGTFKSFGFMTADSNNTKFWFGTSMGNSNVGVYVDDNGYIVVGGPVVTEAGETFEASSANYSGASSLLQYSSAVNNGLYYTSVEEAFADNNKASGSVTVYVDELDMTDINYKGTIVVPEGEEITIIVEEDKIPTWTVTGTDVTYKDNEGNVLEKSENGSFVEPVPAGPAWEGEGTSEAPYLIEDVAGLKAFQESVNSGEVYGKVYFKLTKDIDLAADAVSLFSEGVTPNWEPIGTKEKPFTGEFDGDGKTISNLVVVGEANQGFIGYADKATIKNVNIENATVIGTDCVGAIAGQVYSSSVIDNCHVSGNIQITGETNVGGIVGKYYTKVTNSSVIGDGASTSFVKGVFNKADLEGDNVGGIMGHCGENNNLSGNTVKNITISGTRKVGGIVGIADQNTDVSDCEVDNVVIETTATKEYAKENINKMSIGGLIGQYQAAGSSVDGTVKNSTVSNVEFVIPEGVVCEAGVIAGGARGGTDGMLPPSNKIVATGNTVTNVTGATNEYLQPAVTYVAEINGVGYETLADALKAASAMTDDVTVEIFDKVTLSQTLSGSYSSIKFVGKADNAEIYLDIEGYIEAIGKDVAFEDLILSKSKGGYIDNAGFMNVAFGVYHANSVNYTDCIFTNGAYASSGENTFNNCTFYKSYDKYGLWAYGNVDVVVDGCTFADYRGIKMYAEGAAKTVDLTVKNTDFSAVTDKPAIVLTYGESVTLENNTYSSTGIFELDLDGAPNGTPVTSDVAPTCKNDNGVCGVLVDGKIYTTVAQAADVATEGSKVTLLHDSTETVKFVEGVELDKNGFEAAGVTVAKASPVAKIGDTEYATLAEAAEDAKAGDTITLIADATIAENTNVTIPDGVTLNGNGFSISASGANHDTGTNDYGCVKAGGNLTIAGITKVEKFVAGTNHTITIGEGASLQVTGKARVTLGYGSHFNVVGTIEDAKTADKAELIPSLLVSSGFSITGGTDTNLNVKNAYVVIGNTSSKNSAADGTFDLNFENSIAEFTNQFTLSEPTSGMNPTFNVNLEDSVMTTATKLCIAAPNTTMVIDNSTVTLGSYLRNSGELTLINGSNLTGSMIQFGESGGNDGDIIVDNSTLTIKNNSTAHAMDGKGVGSLTLKNGAVATIDYIKDSFYSIDNTSTLNVKELINCEEQKEALAKIGDTEYATVKAALDAAKAAGMTDVTITLVGETTKESAKALDDSFYLYTLQEFDSVTFKQEDSSVPYYIAGIYTGSRTNGGTFVFDGVNIVVLDQYILEGNVKLTNNSVIKSVAEANCFIYNGETTIEPGSKIYGVIEDFRGGKVVIDGGKTDGGFNETPDMQDSIMHIRWAGDSLTVKNGAFLKVNAVNEIGRLNLAAGTSLNISASKVEAWEYIDNAGTINIDVNSMITTKKITGTGKIVIDAAKFDGNDVPVIDADMSGITGSIEVINNSGAEYKIEDGKLIIVAKNVATVTDSEGNVTSYANIQTALKALKSGATLTLLADITVDEKWDARYTGSKITVPVTIDGNGHTMTFTDVVYDGGNQYAAFRFEVPATVKNLTIDMTNAISGFQDRFRAISSKDDLTVDNCTFIGNGSANNTRAIIFGEGAGAAISDVEVSVTNSTFTGWRRGVSDNENAQDAKSVVISGNTFTDAEVNVSATDVITFTDNTVSGKYVKITSYTQSENLVVTATGNTLTVNVNDSNMNFINVASKNVTAQKEFYIPVENVAEVNGVGYATLQEALDAAAAGTGNITVEILDDIDLTNVDWNPVTVSGPGYPVVTVNGNGKTITALNDMLFAGTWAGGSGLIINDLTISDSNIVNDENDTKGTVGVGAFIGYPQASATIILNNCHLVNSTVNGGHWTGGLIGMAGGYNGNDGPVFMDLTITGCSVTGSTITGKGSAGGIIGHGSCAAWTNVIIENTTVSGNTITSTGSSTNKAGAVMGTIGAAGQSTTANGETKIGGAYVSATVSGNTVTSNATPITTIYGRQGTNTGMLYVTGGTYDNYPIEENVAYAQPREGYEIVQNADGTYGVTEKEAVELFEFYGMNLDLESSVKANFYILASYFEATNYYAEIVHSSAEGNITSTVNFADWEDNGSYKQITYTDLAAKNMADTVTVTIYDGNGTRVSVDYVKSIKTYAEDYIKAYAGTGDKWVTPFVDMLNYGAEAQKYFDYNEENLANADIDQYQMYATENEIELEADVDSSEHVFGANLDLENKIVYNGYFSDVTDDMTAEVSYTDHLGNPITHTAKLVPNGSYHQVAVDSLVIADANQLVTITVKDSNGDVYAFRSESINGYLYRTIAAKPEFEPLARAMAKFTTSAHTALHAK